MGVDQGFAQHLQPAANAQHRSALRRMLGHGLVQALGTQPSQVAAGVFGAGQDHPIGGLQARQVSGWVCPQQAQAGHVVKWLELI